MDKDEDVVLMEALLISLKCEIALEVVLDNEDSVLDVVSRPGSHIEISAGSSDAS